MAVAAERFGRFGGYETRYLEAGNPADPAIVLLHDGAWGGSSSVTWGGVIPFLAERYHVLAPDMLGFGGTDKVVFLDRAPVAPRIGHLSAFLATLLPNEGVHLVGTSFGGSVALRWMAEDESRLLSVTALAGTGGPWRTRLSLEGLRDWDGTRDDMERIVGLLVNRGPNFDQLVDERLQWASVPGHYRSLAAVAVPMPAALSGGGRVDHWPEPLATTSIPLHLIAGERDELLEPDWPQRITQVRPNARITRLSGAPHSPNLDTPELVAKTVVAGI